MKLSERIAIEAAVVIAGAILAAWAIGQAPALRDWIARQWAGAKPAGCQCGGVQ